MAWYQQSGFTPSTLKAAVAAGAILAGGWIDQAGSIWSIDANARTVSATAGAANPAATGQLVRPSGEAAVNQRARMLMTYMSSSHGTNLLFRLTPGSTGSGYVCGVSGAFLYLGKLVNGVLSSITTRAWAPVVGCDYMIEGSVVQTNGTTSTLSVQAYAADGVTAIGTAFTTNDTNASLQNASGVVGLYEYVPAGGQPTAIKGLWTYSDTAAVAASYSLTGPAAGSVGQPSTYTVAANGTLSSAVTVTPSDGGAGGTFNPATVTLAAGSAPAGTTVYTPASTGAKAVSTANGGGLTDPAAMSLNTLILLPVSGPAFKFSPGNWKGDTGRGGDVWRQTWNVGATVDIVWNAGASPTASLLLPAASSGCVLAYILNGALTDSINASNVVAISGVVANALNTLRVILRSSPQTTRWNNAANTLRVLGLQVSAGSSAATAAAASGWDIIIGDSLTEGIGANNFTDNHLYAWSYQLARAINDLGRDVCVNACGISGWLRPGDSEGDVPALYKVASGVYADASSRWNKIDSGVSLLDSAGKISAYGALNTPPTNIWVMMGTNEAIATLSISDTTASVQQFLVAVRVAAPAARIRIIIPFGIYNNTTIPGGTPYATAIKAGVAAYLAANPGDGAVDLIDLGADFSALLTSTLYGGAVVHWGAAGHALAGARMAARAASGNTAPQFRRTFRG